MKIKKEFHAEIIKDYDKFNEFLSDYTGLLLQRMLQMLMAEIPNILLYQIGEVQKTEKLKEKFQKDNKDLQDNMDLVLRTANVLQEQHIEWDEEKLLEEAGNNVRKMSKEFPSNGQGI